MLAHVLVKVSMRAVHPERYRARFTQVPAIQSGRIPPPVSLSVELMSERGAQSDTHVTVRGTL